MTNFVVSYIFWLGQKTSLLQSPYIKDQ